MATFGPWKYVLDLPHCENCGILLSNQDTGGHCQECLDCGEGHSVPTPAPAEADERIPMECPNCGGLGGWDVYAVCYRYRIPCPVCGGTGIGHEALRTEATSAIEMLTCEACGELKADCVNQTPASEDEAGSIHVCRDCRDALDDEMEPLF